MVVTTRKQAIALRQARYFTGKPCKYGHIAPRHTLIGNCTICVVEKQRTERARIRERLAAAER